MFLHSLERTNPAFIAAAIELHQAGRIPANSYVLDLDMIAENARHILAETKKHGLIVYPMTKQFGRNPEAIKVIADAGADGFVAVDMACARAIKGGGFELGHIGHLVQVPRHEIAEALSMSPHYWTVFSLAQAEAINRLAKPANPQKILLRVYGEGDIVVPTHAGGFLLSEIEQAIAHIARLPNVLIAGVTTYPSASFDRLERKVAATPNVGSMNKAADILRSRGVANPQINMASELSSGTIHIAAEGGATQVEPGHAFTGTSPYQIFADAPERQSMIYLSEVSHLEGGGAFCFGGGLYECIGAVEHAPEALVGRSAAKAANRVRLTTPPNGVIDFYGRLDYAPGTDVQAGDTVIVCTRPQAFFTRAFVVPVRGIQSGRPEALGVWDATGFKSAGVPKHAGQ